MKKWVRLLNFSFFIISFSGQLFAQDPFTGPIDVYSGDTYVSVGVAWGDYNNDNYQDLYISNGAQGYTFANFLYLNNGNGTFTKITEGDIVTYAAISGGCAWGDYNNDGLLDLYVAYVVSGFSGLPNKLYLNNGDGSFTEGNAGPIVTDAVSTSTVSWTDYNNDSWIDGFTSNTTIFGYADKHRLYVNNGDSTFSSVSNNLTNGVSAFGGVAWADYNNDGNMDVVTVAGASGESSVLWKNIGSDFSDSTLSTGNDAQAASWGDYDNDGDFDLYITNYGDSDPEKNLMFRNDGALGMTKIITGDIVNDEDYSYGSAWGDYDNDGDLDLFVANDGDTLKCRLYVNNGDATFSKLNSSVVVDSVGFSRGCAWADYDNDGDLDLVIGRDGANYIFKNNGNSNNYVNIELEGTDANKAAIGAVVRLKATIGGKSFWQIRDVSSQTGYGGHSSLRLHFGLGDATVIDTVKIEWPGSGNIDIYKDITPNNFYEFIENNASHISISENKFPEQFHLFQNYPNPFNPNTNIRFSLPKSDKMLIEIYNVAGQRVHTLYEGYKMAGNHVIGFNASHLPSGIYYYRLRTSNFDCVKKMMLIK